MPGTDNTARVWNAAEGTNLIALAGHSDDVVSVAYSPDGRSIVTASQDDTARVWHHQRPPEYWWGVAWLPQFWLAIALGAGLLASLWRDRKRIG